MAPTILIVDDDSAVREALSSLVRSAGMKAETYASAEEFLKRLAPDGPCCVVLDLRMPGMDGAQLHIKLSEMDYCPPIIFLSAYARVPTVVGAMKRGAADYLQKPVDEEELLGAINDALAKDRELRRENQVAREIHQSLALLTPREYEVLRFVVRGMLNKQTASELGIAEKTVKVHRGRIMQNMGATSLADLVRKCELADIR